MTDQHLIDQYLKNNKVTKCPPVVAQGADCTKLTREQINKERRDWRDQDR